MTSDGSSGEYSSDEEYSEDMTEDSEDFSDDTSDLSDDEELTEESIISSEESSKNLKKIEFIKKCILVVEIKQKKSKKKEKIDETKKSKKSESKPEPKKSQKSSNKSNPKSSQKPVKTALQNGHQSKSKRSSSKEKSRKISIQDDEPFKWGFTLNQVYRTAVRFYKDKEGRAFNLAYNVSYYLRDLSIFFLNYVLTKLSFSWASVPNVSKNSNKSWSNGFAKNFVRNPFESSEILC